MKQAIDKNGKVWTAKEIRYLLLTNDTAVIRGMLKIYQYQTADERRDSITKYNNNVGFNGADSFILSQFCTFFNAKRFLSPKQLAKARKRMIKYAGQLLKCIAIENPEKNTQAANLAA